METQYTDRHVITRTGDNAITLEEAKLYIKQDLAADDAVVNDIVTSVIAEAELVTRRQMNTAETIVQIFEIEAPNDEGHYILELYWDDSEIEIVSIAAIDLEGDAVTISEDDYQLRDNQLWFLTKPLNGHRLTVTCTCTTTAAAMAKYKEGLLEVVANKYVNRSSSIMNSVMVSLGNFISGRNWL